MLLTVLTLVMCRVLGRGYSRLSLFNTACKQVQNTDAICLSLSLQQDTRMQSASTVSEAGGKTRGRIWAAPLLSNQQQQIYCCSHIAK